VVGRKLAVCDCWHQNRLVALFRPKVVNHAPPHLFVQLYTCYSSLAKIQ
jgi:hypothetical protein